MILNSYVDCCFRFLPHWTNTWRQATARLRTCLLSMLGASRLVNHELNEKHLQEKGILTPVCMNFFFQPPIHQSLAQSHYGTAGRQTADRGGGRCSKVFTLTWCFSPDHLIPWLTDDEHWQKKLRIPKTILNIFINSNATFYSINLRWWIKK